MARGTKLSVVRTMFKYECGIANDTNTDLDNQINQLLSDKQMWLSGEYDWPFLQHRWSVPCPQGTMFLTFPTVDDDAATYTINFDRPIRSDVYYTQKWQPVDYGIGNDEYNIWNSYIGEANDPIQRWQYNDQGGFEVWPLPVTAQILRFTAIRIPVTLLTSPTVWNDNAVFDLDDLLVVYFAAAEWLARMKQQDAAAKMALAKERMLTVRATYPSRTREVVLGGEQFQGAIRRIIPAVVVHG